MLHIHFANRYETLTALLLGRLSAAGAGVFDADQVIVPSEAVRRSLTLAIADHAGVCANVQFDFLARWLWKQIGRVVPGVAEESPFAADALSWRVYTAFGDAAFVDAHPRLAAYLQAADDVMLYELARRVAALLEQYVTYRPDWLALWLQGRPADLGPADDGARADERWQAALWRRINAELGLDALHPVTDFVAALQRSGPEAARRAGLPATVHVFALPTMPPLHVRLLQQAGRWVDVHLYVINPCREYWFEVIDRRRLAHLALRGRADAHEEGNRLLAAWGRQTQSHVDLLVDTCGDAADDDAFFEPHPARTLLARLQNAILDLAELAPGSVALDESDRSIELHRCHSATRELEVLQDHLLDLFAADPSLQPSSVLVVAPDLEAVAPLVDAVFGTAPRERFIPYAVTGRARSGVNAPARALLALLALAPSRMPATGVFGLLQQAIVARRFGLDDEALQQVHDWLHESGFRWALDAGHRAGFGVPASARHTLADALDRLFLGYALPSQAGEPFGPWLPAGGAEGSDAAVLGAFWRFATALQRLHAAVSAPQTAQRWAALLVETIETFLAPADDELDDQRELQDAIRELAGLMQRGGATQPVPLAVIRSALEQQLDDPARGGVPTGGVTFSSISSLRNLPYAHVCAIGLNDGGFPTSSRPPEFDLMALHPRRGDRQRRVDERNLFLDLLLAARESLYLSHTGRSVRDNAALPPSVLVSELLDVLVPAIADDPASADSRSRARARLLVDHPLQPFAIEGFAAGGDPRLRSFNRELGDALRCSLQAPPLPAPARGAGAGSDEADEADEAGEDEGAGAGPAAPPFFAAPLAPPGPEWCEVSLAQLAEFFRNPCRYLLRRRLGIDLQREADELLDDEPFLPDLPGRSALARRLLPPLLQGASAQDVRRLALAGTEMPGGALGARQLQRELESLARFAQRLRAVTAEPCLAPHQASIAIDLDGEAWRLGAGFADLRSSGLVRWRYDKLRAGDALEAWLHHLAMCADPPTGLDARTQWLSLDGVLQLRAPADPGAILQDLLRIYRRGLVVPVHFFPKSAWAWCEKDERASAASAAWRVTKDHPFGEESDPAYRLALRGRGDALNDEFFTLARAVFGPLREHTVAGSVSP